MMSGLAQHNLVEMRYDGRQSAPAKAAPLVMRQLLATKQRALLTEAIVSGVIPYLASLDPGQATRPTITDDDIVAFTGLLLDNRQVLAREHVMRLRTAGVSRETIYLELFAPAARLLGQRWMDDGCSFVEVTIGVGCMQKIVHGLSVSHACREIETRAGRRVMLATTQDEQHTFGMTILAEFFVRAGWETRCKPRIAAESLTALVKAEWFDVLGLSTGSEVRFRAVAELIRAVRRSSRNPALRVLVGGPAFQAHPDAAVEVGADATAADAREAVRQAECLSLSH